MPSSDERDFVLDILVSIAVLKAKLMRALWSCREMPDLIDSIQPLQERFRTWYGRLPHAAQLDQLSSGSYIPLKASIYYAHLLHTGATMLIFRRCLSISRHQKGSEKLSNEHQNLLGVALSEGIKAAQHTARVLLLVRGAPQSVRHFWITMSVFTLP